MSAPFTQQDREAVLYNLRNPLRGMEPYALEIAQRYEATVALLERECLPFVRDMRHYVNIGDPEVDGRYEWRDGRGLVRVALPEPPEPPPPSLWERIKRALGGGAPQP